jgi:hypothetical protein
MLAVLDLTVIVAWVLLYGRFFAGLLRLHRTGDPDLARRISRLKLDMELSRPKPRPIFYVGIVLAIVFLLLFLYTRKLL